MPTKQERENQVRRAISSLVVDHKERISASPKPEDSRVRELNEKRQKELKQVWNRGRGMFPRYADPDSSTETVSVTIDVDTGSTRTRMAGGKFFMDPITERWDFRFKYISHADAHLPHLRTLDLEARESGAQDWNSVVSINGRSESSSEPTYVSNAEKWDWDNVSKLSRLVGEISRQMPLQHPELSPARKSRINLQPASAR